MRKLKINVLLLLMAFFVSCQKAQRDEDIATNTCEDISLAQTVFSDAFMQVRYAAMNTEGISDATSTVTSRYDCEEFQADTNSNPRTITINYKFIGCSGLDAERSGRLIASFNGKFGEPGSAVDIDFSNYFFQDFQVSGKLRVIFKDADSESRPVQTFYLQDGLIDDGETVMTWTASQTWVLIDGEDAEPAFQYTGTSNGINRKGNVFFSETMTANIISDGCLWPKSGTTEVEIQNLSLRIMDYGAGSCDQIGSAVINGSSHDFIIPK